MEDKTPNKKTVQVKEEIIGRADFEGDTSDNKEKIKEKEDSLLRRISAIVIDSVCSFVTDFSFFPFVFSPYTHLSLPLKPIQNGNSHFCFCFYFFCDIIAPQLQHYCYYG